MSKPFEQPVSAPTVRSIPAQGNALGHGKNRSKVLKGRPKTACRHIAPARQCLFPSSFIPQPSSLNLHPSTFIPQPSSLNLHPSTFILTMIPPGYKQTEVGVIP